MCSFNQLNGDYACENRLLLVDILKRQLGFDGFVLTDFGAAHSTVAVAQQRPRHGDRQPPVLHAGDDPRRPSQSGQVTEATVDEHVHRILRTMFEHGLFEDDPAPSAIPVEEHGETAREIAERRHHAAQEQRRRAAARRPAARLGRGDRRRRQPRPRAGRRLARDARRTRCRCVDGIRDRAPGGVDVEYAPGTDPVGPTSMLPGPAAAPSSIFTPPGGGEPGCGRRTSRSTDLSGDPDRDAHGSRRALRAGFLGGRPAFFGSLYGSQLPPTPGDARLGALHRDVHRARLRRLHVRADGLGRGADVPRRRAGDRLRHRGRRRGDGEHRDAEPGRRRRARGR